MPNGGKDCVNIKEKKTWRVLMPENFLIKASLEEAYSILDLMTAVSGALMSKNS